MSVDMSSAAITGRLRAMGDLWELSVALMSSKIINPNSQSGKGAAALKMMDSIRQLLLKYWDPIGIEGIPEAPDEYDSYIPRIYRILLGTRSEQDLIECLSGIERNEMGGAWGIPERRIIAAQKLLDLKVTLD